MGRRSGTGTAEENNVAGPRASGVIIAVKMTYVGQWEAVEKGPAGRAVATNLVL